MKARMLWYSRFLNKDIFGLVKIPLFMAMVLIPVIHILLGFSHVAKTPDIVEVVVEEPQIVSKDVSLMAKYIKMRNSKIPTEVSVMIAESVKQTSEEFNMSPLLINGIMEMESVYDCYSISSKGARGLMQVLIEDGVEINEKKAFDITYNIRKGAEIFNSKLKKSEGNIRTALFNYAGKKKDYPENVYENIGRYVMFLESENYKSIEISQK
jgi:hypothetical protein